MSKVSFGRRHVSRGAFLKGAAGLIGTAAAVGAGPAWAQSAPGVTNVRPMSGQLAGSRTGRTAEYTFNYPGGEVVYTVELHVEPDGLIGPRAGFRVFNPTGAVHVVGGTQSGLVPNVSANVVSRQPGTYVVQVFNYHESAAMNYWVRVRPGRREGQTVPVVPSFGVSATTPLIVYVGTGGRGEGVFTYRMDPNLGELTRVDLAKIEGPGWVTLDPDQRFLYAAISGNRVASFGIDQTTGKLSPLNAQPTGTGGHAHISVDPSGRYLVGASWGAGTVGVYPIGPDGSLAEASHVVKHEGSPGPHPDQTQARAHQVPFDPSGQWAVVTDLGLDRVYVYRLDAASGKLVANDPPFAQMERGRGPRHMSWHPSGRFLYVINELNSTMTAFAWQAESGRLTELQTLSTLPEGWTGRKWSAQVVVHPSGKFVYGSNRGSGGDSDDIAIFAIDQESGMLTPIGHQPSGGKVPRNFNVDPSGSFMLVAHQDGDSVIPYWIDQESGLLAPTGQVVAIANPLCIQFADKVGIARPTG